LIRKEETLHTYFISYVFYEGDNLKPSFGNTILATNHRLNTDENLKDTEDWLLKCQPDLENTDEVKIICITLAL